MSHREHPSDTRVLKQCWMSRWDTLCLVRFGPQKQKQLAFWEITRFGATAKRGEIIRYNLRQRPRQVGLSDSCR